MKILTFAIALIFISNTAYSVSTRVLPIYNGFWYVHVDIRKLDTCSPTEHFYEAKFPDKDSLLAKLSAELPHHDECTWEIYITYDTKDAPKDFPGSDKEYQKIIATDKQYTGGLWEAYCYQGETLINWRNDQFYPSFKCPAGTYENYDLPGCYKVANPFCYDENGNPKPPPPRKLCFGCGCDGWG